MEKKELFWSILNYLLGVVLVAVVYFLFEDMQEATFVLVGLIYLQASKLKQ